MRTEGERVEFEERMREERDKFLDGMTQTAAVTHERAALKNKRETLREQAVTLLKDETSRIIATLRHAVLKRLSERVNELSDDLLIDLLVALRK